jgi:hypothetical protein
MNRKFISVKLPVEFRRGKWQKTKVIYYYYYYYMNAHIYPGADLVYVTRSKPRVRCGQGFSVGPALLCFSLSLVFSRIAM